MQYTIKATNHVLGLEYWLTSFDRYTDWYRGIVGRNLDETRILWLPVSEKARLDEVVNGFWSQGWKGELISKDHVVLEV